MKPKILLTNDDGISAPGLRSLWRALVEYADLSIVAPMDDASGSGVGITLKTPLRADTVAWEGETAAWKVNGKPADCVKLGLGMILKEKPDLVVAGINRGANSGKTVLVSGTVGAAIAATMNGVPGIAFSCEDYLNPNYGGVEHHILSLVKHFLEHPLPKGTILNVNFPEAPIRGYKLARQGQGIWISNTDKRVHPSEGTPYFWLDGRWEHSDEAHDSDIILLQQGYITVVPIRVDELTHNEHLENHREFFEKKFN